MATNKRTDFDGEAYEQPQEPYTVLREDVQPEKSKPTRAHFMPLQNYATDRRTDPRARDYENMIALPYVDGFIERFKSVALPGHYYMELRAGRAILGGELIEVAPGVRAAEPAPVNSTQSAAPILQESSAHSINGTTETIRATKELLKEFAPSSQVATPSKDDIAQMIEAAVSKVAAQNTQTTQDPFAILERAIDLQRKLQPEAPRAVEPTINPKDAAQLMLVKESGIIPEFMRNMRDMVHAPETVAEPETMVDKVLGFARDLLENPFIGSTAGPAIANKLVAVLQHVDVGTLAQHVNSQAASQPQQRPTPEAPPAPMPQTTVDVPEQQREGDDAAITIDIVLANIITDIQHNDVPDDCIDDVVRLATEDSKWQPALAQILELPNVEILKTLKDAKGIDLSPLNNAGKFLDGLRKGVKARIKLQAPPTAQAAASNGNGTAASLKTA
jgi:hypothetical protein